MNEIVRYATAPDLVDGVAQRLLSTLIEQQTDHPDRPVQLCLTGGRIANRIYEALTALPGIDELDPERLELWWGDERFVPTEDPDRHAGHTLAILAGRLPLAPGLTHPMPAADGVVDNDASAIAYEKDLGDTEFDICLLGLGADGHVASIFPDHPSFEEQTRAVIGVSDSPTPPTERISLTVPALSRSHEIWYLVSGAEKADAVARSVEGDEAIPGGVVRGTERTVWLLDRDAGAGVPYHHCSF